MKPVAILYATREGHTRRIAEHVAAEFRAQGYEATAVDVAKLAAPFTLADYAAAVLAGSIHAGSHEKELVRFVKAQRDVLARMPTAFLSISLSEAGAESTTASAAARDRATRAVEEMIEHFYTETGWRAERTMPVAGALLYTQYNILKRLVMKRIVRGEGGDTDSSRDYEYTDWTALDRFVKETIERLAERPSSQVGA